MTKTATPDVETVRAYFTVSEEGRLIHARGRCIGQFADTAVSYGGSAKRNPYRQVSFKGKRLYAHRVVVLITTGVWPIVVNHRDGNTLNNTPSNLQSTDAAWNAAEWGYRRRRAGKKRNLPHGISSFLQRGREYYVVRISVAPGKVRTSGHASLADAIKKRDDFRMERLLWEARRGTA